MHAVQFVKTVFVYNHTILLRMPTHEENLIKDRATLRLLPLMRFFIQQIL